MDVENANVEGGIATASGLRCRLHRLHRRLLPLLLLCRSGSVAAVRRGSLWHNVLTVAPSLSCSLACSQLSHLEKMIAALAAFPNLRYLSAMKNPCKSR